ncbi:hypothetical protein SODG_000775 [Sodalis praecaptivus]|nr:hypothetical protein NVIRENTERO_02304 [Sodalis praecaptivus]
MAAVSSRQIDIFHAVMTTGNLTEAAGRRGCCTRLSLP